MMMLIAAENPYLTPFLEGLWGGVFQLVALALVAFWVQVVYQRYRRRADGRQELIDEIDEFTVALYKPRKLYMLAIDKQSDMFAAITDEATRELRRAEMTQQCVNDMVDAIGRFRALQVKIVPLYGYSHELFGYYMAIWRYLKKVRKCMQAGDSLYFHHENPESMDAFFRLIDAFRYRISIAAYAASSPGLVRPPADDLQKMRSRGDQLYKEFFEAKPSEPAS